jgi:Tol biopolymer transport system component
MVVAVPVLIAGTAYAAPGDLTLASTDDAGVNGIGRSFVGRAGLSGDGGQAAFHSSASLDGADPDGLFDIYVKDLSSDATHLVSTNSVGTKSDGDSNEAAFSADGGTVAFQSTATNLDDHDTDTLTDVYVKDLSSGSLVLASTSSSGAKGNSLSLSPTLSSDGTVVAFESFATNLHPDDDDTRVDIYVKDLVTGALTLASTSSSGAKGTEDSAFAALSADGTAVAFQTFSNLDAADTDASADVYVKDLVSGTTTLASTSDTGATGDGASAGPSLSADGTKVAFVSTSSNLDPADTDPIHDVFVKDLVSGEVSLGSVSAGGLKSDDINLFTSALSHDGNRVAFVSMAGNLSSADGDTLLDVYVKDLSSGVLTLASTSSAGVKGNDDSGTWPALSGDGTLVAFESMATNLDPADGDADEDVYVKGLSFDAGPATVEIAIAHKATVRGGTYTVMVFSDVTFDATKIDVTTVCFGSVTDPSSGDCTAIGGAGMLRDVNEDGLLDMRLRFESSQTGLDDQDVMACIIGETSTGTPFEGCGPL